MQLPAFSSRRRGAVVSRRGWRVGAVGQGATYSDAPTSFGTEGVWAAPARSSRYDGSLPTSPPATVDSGLPGKGPWRATSPPLGPYSAHTGGHKGCVCCSVVRVRPQKGHYNCTSLGRFTIYFENLELS